MQRVVEGVKMSCWRRQYSRCRVCTCLVVAVLWFVPVVRFMQLHVPIMATGPRPEPSHHENRHFPQGFGEASAFRHESSGACTSVCGLGLTCCDA